VGDTIERHGTEVYDEYARLFREHPFYDPPDATAWLSGLIERRSFREIWHIDDTREVKA